MIKRKKKVCKECNELRYLFSKGRCKECAQKSYSKPKTKKKYISPISKKQTESLKKYRKLRDEYMANHPKCEVCGKDSQDLHHKLHVRTGRALTDVKWFMAVCRSCHNKIHENHSWAVKNGYLADALTKHKYFMER